MTRRGMTLIELVVSLSISGVLVMAMGSSILIASQALPRSGGEAESLAAAARGWSVIAEDLRLADDVTITDGTWLEIEIPESGDLPERTIRIGTTVGTPDRIVRKAEDGPAGLLIGAVSDLTFTRIDGTATDAPDRIRAEFRVAGHAFVGEQRLLNTVRSN